LRQVIPSKPGRSAQPLHAQTPHAQYRVRARANDKKTTKNAFEERDPRHAKRVFDELRAIADKPARQKEFLCFAPPSSPGAQGAKMEIKTKWGF